MAFWAIFSNLKDGLNGLIKVWKGKKKLYDLTF